MQNSSQKVGNPIAVEVKGHYTRLLGERVESLIAEQLSGKFKVFYDHKLVNPDRIIVRMGPEESPDNMAYADIAIVAKAGNIDRLILLSEIEEHKHSPKRLLGDLAAIAMSDYVEVDGVKHPLADLTIVLGLIVRPGGRVETKSSRFVSKFEKAVGEGVSGKRGIKFEILCGESGEQMIRKVEDRFKELMSGGISDTD
jgi:hypothetical protein